MNQILVTQKVYITPELKKKKKMYRMGFVMCIIVIIILALLYIYAEYDRYVDNMLADDLLSNIDFSQVDDDESNDNTIINETQNSLIVSITEGAEDDDENLNSTLLGDKDKNIINSGKYTATNGKQYAIIGIIEIPKINVKYPIIAETSDALLKVSVCKFWGPDANQVGNLCVVGHNYKNSKFFSKVPSMVCGDIVKITDLTGTTVEYEVYDVYTVEPSDTRCTSQLTQGRREVTVITCTDDTKFRVVVKCKEIK
ncbi:MAG: sortase [Clostridia bacterium]|nr:sortase [Clostridia bacterium]